MYVRHITARSNKFMEDVGVFESIWKLIVSFNSSYTIILRCLRVPRPVRTGSGNNPVPGVCRSVASVMVSVLVTMT